VIDLPGFAELLAPHAGGEKLDRLVRYGELLELWSETHNLVRFSDRRELVERHLVDALAAVEMLGETGELLDIGSGAGLPGVPLLVARPRWTGVLLEPRQKRWAFLRMVIRELDLDARAERARFQELAEGRSWDLITARAVGAYDRLLGWAKTRLTADGMVMVWTTEGGERGLQKQPGWRMLSSALPGLERGRLARLQPCFT